MIYSQDLRWRIVYARIARRKRVNQIARTYEVSIPTVYRALQRFKRYGHVRPARIGRPDISQLLTHPQLLVLMEYLLKHPTAYLNELNGYLLRVTGSQYAYSSLNKILRRHGYSRKRVSSIIRVGKTCISFINLNTDLVFS